MVFFVYFGLVRLSIFTTQAALWLPVVFLRTLPVASILYRWWRPAFFVTGVRLDARDDLTSPIETLDLRDVGVGRQRASDTEYQQRISEIIWVGGKMATHHRLQSSSLSSRNTYFQLMPIASSTASLFSRWVSHYAMDGTQANIARALCGCCTRRLRAYLKALTTQYSLGAVVRSWFFGSHISPISLAILFDPLPEKQEAATVVDDTTAASAMKKLQ